MYRLLIVDDEPVIVNGLVQLFQENEQFELDVCRAYSAKEAIEIAKKMKLDILVSDIRMPQKNGLQLMDEITYYWPLCRVIFLTGYSEFDYVHEAIRKNVDNYILKTEGIDPIFEAVREATNKLDAENRRRIQEEKAKLHFQIAEPLLRNELVERVLNGEPIEPLLAEPRYQELDFEIAADQDTFFLIGGLEAGENQHSRTLIASVQQAFANYLPAMFACETAVLEGEVPIWLLQPGEELLGRFQTIESAGELHWNGLVAYMRGILELVQNECEELLGTAVSFGISGNLNGRWDKARGQFEMLRKHLRGRVSLGQSMVVVDIEKTNAQEEALYERGRMQQEDMKSFVIDQIHRYILEHLSGDLSLTAIAEEVHFNPSYLSRYYKQATGHNLLEYIQTKRLEGATHLMRETNLKLNEIAARVGFETHSYFTTFFKKKMGVSPQEYRNKQCTL
ncbi:response regulator [Paenibacillus sp.]|jgi:two-component system response regulator YesN|uniref:response regulator transcription factor n=1 Tax=Paenibacillus sp. TaxID=58172 RepID=UPI00283A9390|nr:response regulator [Paenibacillus sp.]